MVSFLPTTKIHLNVISNEKELWLIYLFNQTLVTWWNDNDKYHLGFELAWQKVTNSISNFTKLIRKLDSILSFISIRLYSNQFAAQFFFGYTTLNNTAHENSTVNSGLLFEFHLLEI